MSFTAAFATTDSHSLTETSHKTLSGAVAGVIATVNTHPDVLKGHQDLAVITDDENGETVVALFRMNLESGSKYVLARESIDAKYEAEMDEIGFSILDLDSDPYRVFATWNAGK